MNILICDTDKKNVNEMTELLRKYAINNHLNIMGTSDCNELIDLIKNFKFNLAYIDTKIGSLNGVDIAKKILEKESQCLITFITHDASYVADAFKIKAFQYLLKPCSKEMIIQEFDRAMAQMNKSKNVYCINTSNGKRQIQLKNVIFVETYYTRIKIYTCYECFESNIKNLAYIKEFLNKPSFVRIHQSYYVNMAYIDDIVNKKIFLKNGMHLSISARYKKEVMGKYITFLGEENQIK